MKGKIIILLILIVFISFIFFFEYYFPLKNNIKDIKNSIKKGQSEITKLDNKINERESKLKKWENTVRDIEFIKKNYMLKDKVLLRFKIEELINSSGIIPESENIVYRRLKGSDYGVLSFEFRTKAEPKLFELFRKIRKSDLLIGISYLKVNSFPDSSVTIRLRGLVYEKE